MKLEAHRIRQLLSRRATQRINAPRHAAVAIVLRLDDPTSILLIRRAKNPQDPWSGHVAFPGGRRSGKDPTLLSTAIRETHEELALDLVKDAEHLGRLDDIGAVARGEPVNLVISPFVFAIQKPVSLQPDEAEVEEALWAPVGPMIDGSTKTEHPYRHRGQDLLLPAFKVGPHVLWGLTFRMLTPLLDIITHR